MISTWLMNCHDLCCLLLADVTSHLQVTPLNCIISLVLVMSNRLHVMS